MAPFSIIIGFGATGIGLTSLVASYLEINNRKDKRDIQIARLLAALNSLTILCVLQQLFSERVNSPTQLQSFFKLSSMAVLVVSCAEMYRLIHSIFPSPKGMQVKWLAFIVLLGTIITLLIGSTDWWKDSKIEAFYDICLGTISSYILLYSMYSFLTLQRANPLKDRSVLVSALIACTNLLLTQAMYLHHGSLFVNGIAHTFAFVYPIYFIILNVGILGIFRIGTSWDAQKEKTKKQAYMDSTPSGIAEVGANHGLSNREIEVTELLIRGYSYRRISEQLFIAPSTVKTHALNIYQKMDVSSKVELLSFFVNSQKKPAATKIHQLVDVKNRKDEKPAEAKA